MVEAAFTTLALIYHVTVYDLRKEHANAVVGLLMTIVQSSLFILGFYGIYMIMGVRNSPIRGDFILYIMSGIFMFMTYSQTMGAVAGVGAGGVGGLTKHGPLSTAVMITAAALAVLYRQTISIFVLLWGYHVLVKPITLDQPLACYAMLLLAWFSGATVGLVFLALRPWWPQGTKILTQLFQRINMIASGKMFVANTLPPFMLKMFDWNPLFHIVDQTRGFTFINYAPRNSNLEYPIYVGLAVLMIGLMAEFVTRNAMSASWSAGK
ncbi:ABC transporter [Paracoccus sp. DMF-8]|uniref:ABC transporter permease n=1 Tax=Paracoccus sp. DMF-8 TaxID=3019445 RepID=UPI0023E758ED|nr:ABC transporter [Paracoccus sp. DMF-8]MDF3606915.1 ABC transporter [Paracoccus sp. DMF-8]